MVTISKDIKTVVVPIKATVILSTSSSSTRQGIPLKVTQISKKSLSNTTKTTLVEERLTSLILTIELKMARNTIGKVEGHTMIHAASLRNSGDNVRNKLGSMLKR